MRLLRAQPVSLVDEQGEYVEVCSTRDPEVMFPGDDLPNDAPAVVAAKEACSACYFRAQCAELAIERREPHGVWGGLTFKDRQAIIRQRHRRLAYTQTEMLDVAL